MCFLATWRWRIIRLRKTEGGDFDRSQRQQDVIMGIRQRILEYDQLPILIPKHQSFMKSFPAGVRTNLSLDQAIRLAWLACRCRGEYQAGCESALNQVAFAQSRMALSRCSNP